MNELVVLKGDRPITTSLKVAEVLDKRHDNVMRDVRNLKISNEFRSLNFEEPDYIDKNGDVRPMFEMTKTGFTFQVLGYSDERSLAFRERYIAAFEELESARPVIVFSNDDVDRLRCSAIKAFHELRLALGRYLKGKEGPEAALSLLPFVGVGEGHDLHEALRAYNRHETAMAWRRFAPMSLFGHYSFKNVKAPPPGSLLCDFRATKETEERLTKL